jgi:hypothetical protein
MKKKKEVPFVIVEMLKDKKISLEFRQQIAKELKIEIPKK